MDDKTKNTIPALLRLRLWLGLEKQEVEWHQAQSDGELAVFAETVRYSSKANLLISLHWSFLFIQYENQVSVLGNWTNKRPALTRPKWSDVTGKVKLLKERFEPPHGWSWEGEWYVSPELR